MVDVSRNTLVLKQYQLCGRCLARQADVIDGKSAEKCFICRGLMDNLDTIVDRVVEAIKPYEFQTMLVGATLPTQVYEREDALRARLKIRGRESVKSQLTREVGLRLARKTGKKVDYRRPDVIINLTIDKEGNIAVSATARPVAFEGRYVKKARGLPQKQDRCPMCQGKGCPLCDYSGISGYDSVEGILVQQAMAKTGGQTPRISWIGSEDQNSLVLGGGRLFYIRISDPKKRRLKRLPGRDGVSARITRILDDIPDFQQRFAVKTRILVKSDKQFSIQDIRKLRNLAGSEVKFENKKTVTKKIYAVHAKRVSKDEIALTITADGGLPIKQFVGGEEYMDPNISKLLESKCQCVSFDILAVDFQ